MKPFRCPICRSQISLEQLIQDEQGKELMAIIVSLGKQMSGALVSYLALFRPLKQDLSNARAVKLAREVLELTANHRALTQAMDQTVTSIHAKRHQQHDLKPLSNHNYLKQVLVSVQEQCAPAPNRGTSGGLEIKFQGVELTKAQNDQAFKAQLARYSQSATPRYKRRGGDV